MGYCIYRVERIKGGYQGIASEHSRTQDDRGKFSPGIDWEKTKENTHEGTTDYEGRARELCEERGIKPRSNAVLCLDHMVTFSPEAFPAAMYVLHSSNSNADRRWQRSESGQKVRAELERIFGADWESQRTKIRDMAENDFELIDHYFKKAKRWLAGTQGKLISVDIHWDESTPHMHAVTVPLIHDKEKDRWRLSAKDIVGDAKKMSRTQDDFAEIVGAEALLERGHKSHSMAEARERVDLADWWCDNSKGMIAEMEQVKKRKRFLENEAGEAKIRCERFKAKEKEIFADFSVRIAETIAEIKEEAMAEIEACRNDRQVELASSKAMSKIKEWQHDYWER